MTERPFIPQIQDWLHWQSRAKTLVHSAPIIRTNTANEQLLGEFLRRNQKPNDLNP